MASLLYVCWGIPTSWWLFYGGRFCWGLVVWPCDEVPHADGQFGIYLPIPACVVRDLFGRKWLWLLIFDDDVPRRVAVMTFPYRTVICRGWVGHTRPNLLW